MIFYLVYLSTATTLFTDADLSQIISTSQFNNKAIDVTGILLYHDGCILQVLEGDEEIVLKLYKKLQEDDRHHSIIKMTSGRTDARSFPDWSMGFKPLTSIEWAEYSAFLSLHPSNILTKLTGSTLKIDSLVKSFITVNLR